MSVMIKASTTCAVERGADWRRQLYPKVRWGEPTGLEKRAQCGYMAILANTYVESTGTLYENKLV